MVRYSLIHLLFETKHNNYFKTKSVKDAFKQHCLAFLLIGQGPRISVQNQNFIYHCKQNSSIFGKNRRKSICWQQKQQSHNK
jgi:hypothetical protein